MKTFLRGWTNIFFKLCFGELDKKRLKELLWLKMRVKLGTQIFILKQTLEVHRKNIDWTHREGTALFKSKHKLHSSYLWYTFHTFLVGFGLQKSIENEFKYVSVNPYVLTYNKSVHSEFWIHSNREIKVSQISQNLWVCRCIWVSQFNPM